MYLFLNNKNHFSYLFILLNCSVNYLISVASGLSVVFGDEAVFVVGVLGVDGFGAGPVFRSGVFFFFGCIIITTLPHNSTKMFFLK